MTDKQDPIAHAARLLREAAEELRQAHAYNNSEGWENETDAKAAYDEHMAAAQALEDWEAAVGAGGVQALQPEGGPPGSGGWQHHAETMERERDHWRERARTMEEHQRGTVWYWQGDGNDHPESMVNSLPVVIRADQLRALIAGGVQALSAAPGPVSDTQHSQFLTDVLTAAGLITHGKRCKALGERLSDMVMRLRAAPQQEAQKPVAWYEYNADLDAWFLAYRRNPKAKTRPLVFGDTAPQPAPAPVSEMPYEKRKAIQEGEQIGASDAWFHARHNMLDTLDRRNVFRAGFDRGWNAALAAQGGKDALLF